MKNVSYDTEFFGDITYHSDLAASKIVPFIVPLIKPKNVLDIGCGTGTWLKNFQKCGVEDIRGIDGPWVKLEELCIPRERFRSLVIDRNLEITGEFDLVTCLETAEHLDPSLADFLVEKLTSAAPVVLFSAAVPGQGGVGHVNEQLPSYWVKKFESKGYKLVDIIRPQFWSDEQMPFWFQQNTLLFIEKSHPLRKDLEKLPQSALVDVIHPKLYLRQLRTETALHRPKAAASNLARSIFHSIRRR